MINQLTNQLTRLIMFPIVFFFGYGLTLVLAEYLMNYFDYKVNSLIMLIIASVLSSIISFFITLIWYKIFMFFKGSKESFIRRYHYTHLALFYISGLITALITIEPFLIEENFIEKPFNDNLKFSMLILFLAISNYTIFNSVIINDDFKFKKEENSSGG